jgi:predicted small integral membrane protein
MIHPLLPWAIAMIVADAVLGLIFLIAGVRSLNAYNLYGSGWDLAEGIVLCFCAEVLGFFIAFVCAYGR